MSLPDAERHKAATAALFDRLAAGYDSPALRFFPFCADRLVRYVQPAPGQKILDVATGTGAVAVAMAQAVGPSGRVHAIDLSEGMLAKAQANVRKMALANVDFQHMDAGQLEFRKDYFHATVSSFGLFFLPDMAAALRDWARVTRPGGRVVFSAFGAGVFQPLLDRLVGQVLAQGGALPELPGGLRFPHERIRDAAQCEALLRDAGLEAVAVETLQLGYHLKGVEDWWEVVSNSGLRTLVDSLPEARREAVREAHLAALADLVTENGLWLDVEVLVAVGMKQSNL
jgi:ubiquinone/menaquinone biosynthesis C-methylase UbiE